MKGENIISTALAAIVLLGVLALKSKWNPTDLSDAANSAEEFILTRAGMGGQIPEINGYEPLKVYRLGDYRAGLYRAKPAPLVFAPGRFVIYDQSDQPVYKVDTLEGSKDPWSALYDFSVRKGPAGTTLHGRPTYTRDLTGKGVPDVILGQYSGGSHCCTVVTILELGKNAVTSLGRIEGIDGMPFEGLDVRKATKGTLWQCVAHRPYPTACGNHFDAPDVLAVYNFDGQHFEDQTSNFSDYLQDVLRQDLSKWKDQKNQTMDLLQTLAVDYAVVGQKDVARQFFAVNLDPLLAKLPGRNVDEHACLDTLQSLLDRVPIAGIQTP